VFFLNKQDLALCQAVADKEAMSVQSTSKQYYHQKLQISPPNLVCFVFRCRLYKYSIFSEKLTK
jgi:hypothetical protein